MNKTLTFICGIVVGAVATIFILYIIAIVINRSETYEERITDPFVDKVEITMFNEVGNEISKKKFKINKVLDSGYAIADECKDVGYNNIIPTDLEVAFICDSLNNYYDNQIIKISPNCVRQIGILKFISGIDKGKVLPIAKICDK